VTNEKTALTVYREILKKLDADLGVSA